MVLLLYLQCPVLMLFWTGRRITLIRWRLRFCNSSGLAVVYASGWRAFGLLNFVVLGGWLVNTLLEEVTQIDSRIFVLYTYINWWTKILQSLGSSAGLRREYETVVQLYRLTRQFIDRWYALNFLSLPPKELLTVAKNFPKTFVLILEKIRWVSCILQSSNQNI